MELLVFRPEQLVVSAMLLGLRQKILVLVIIIQIILVVVLFVLVIFVQASR